MHYGEEYRRKWQGFSPREMAEIWTRKFTEEEIHPSVVAKLHLHWEHPPTLVQVIDGLHQLMKERREQLRQEMVARSLPAPDQVADPNSPIVQEALAELRRFARRVS